MTRRSEALDLGRYDTDKVPNGYLRYYDEWFAPWIDQPVRLVEIGVHRGGSLQLWCDYFPRAQVIGIDLAAPERVDPRARVFVGSQADPEFLNRTLESAFGGGPADIIIDDASHLAYETNITFGVLFDRWLAPGGLYVIEDWGTGFLPGWPDGRRQRPPAAPSPDRGAMWDSHAGGMVGLMKRWVDELDVHTPLTESGLPLREPRFASIEFNAFMVLFRKAASAS